MGTLVLFDSNIVIDFLHGHELAREIMTARPRYVSVVTLVEVLAGVRSPEEDLLARRMLRHFEVLDVRRDVAEAAVEIRRERRLKLPDALLLATARVHGLRLATRDTKDFDPSDPAILVPYTIT